MEASLGDARTLFFEMLGNIVGEKLRKERESEVIALYPKQTVELRLTE